MKQRTNFGYKFLLCIAAVVAIANAGARGFRSPFDFDPAPPPDTPAQKIDSPKLVFPIFDHTGDPLLDRNPSSIDLSDPSNVNKSVEYDPAENRYYLSEKVGDQFYRNPTYMTLDEYLKYQGQKDEQSYWKRRMDAVTLFNKKPTLPTMYKEGLFDRIFGGTSIQVRPQGNVDVTMGGNWQNIRNPALVQRAQKYGVFDFDMQMNINLLATIGDKMKLNISNNTRATFDYQNMQRLEYTGKEDEIIKKIEAGNISFPLNSTLISGVQSLFGLKTQLQFGKLWVTAAISQQKSKRQSLTIQGGSQTQQFAIKADEYEENKHFLLSQYFHENYNQALKNFPIITSLVNINRIELWVTNRTGAVDGVRDIIGFMDLGERSPYRQTLTGSSVATSVPADNRANLLYDQLLQRPDIRTQPQNVLSLGLDQGVDFERATARKLNPSEYTFNSQLGYLSLNTTLNPDDILAVAFRYTFNGRTYQVGEFAEDLPPDSTQTKTLFMKLLKGTSARPALPIWDLMMKNVYALGGMGVSKEEFRLNVMYQNPGGGEIRYLPEGPQKGVLLLSLLNLDRLNFQNDPQPDGIFDFVEGATINTQQGKIMFPVLEPFGRDLRSAMGGNPQLERKYLYTLLYDSTKTVARQFQQNNRYVIRGSYRSASSSEIFLGGFNIPQGSVSVTAGGQKLVEGSDYQIDYGLGRLKILNAGILNSGIPVNVQYEDNATFGFQQQNFMGARLDYYFNNKLALGGTFMRLTERPFTQKTTFGEDPIKNTVIGLDANYQSEAPGLTRLLDKLPIYSTTASSFVTASGEVAGLFPGHPRQIAALDPEGAVYIDDFEGTRSGIDLRLPAQAWSLASTPANARDRNGRELFPEAKLSNNVDYGKNRARLAWYTIEPSLIDAIGGVPEWVKRDPDQHYIRLVQQQDVFPARSLQTLQNGLMTFDLAFYPRERGPYNFDTRLNADGTLQDPQARWGGIQRAIDFSDFEQSNVEFVEFWVMDPFINKPNSTGGQLYLNLGNVSEDVLKDSRKFFENGIPNPKNTQQLQSSVWGFSPALQTQIVRAFDNDEIARAVQDVGYDGLDDEEERAKFSAYLNQLPAGLDAGVLSEIQSDPAHDNYRHFRGSAFDQANSGILQRYKRFNNPHGNSPVVGASQTFSNAGTNIPESEDINRDNTLNEAEDYFEYRIDIAPNRLQVGTNYIVNSQTSRVRLPNGNFADETWYQFKIPIREYQQRVGNIPDFRSIRFMRLFMNGFEDSVVLRFARLELGRNQWRRYEFSLQNPGEIIPDEDQRATPFAVTSVSVEENSGREPVPYVIPPGVDRQQAQVATGAAIQLNEQALSLQVCNLTDGDARAVFKEVGVDMRQFARLRMFVHAESQVGQTPLRDGDVAAIIRLGSDFTNNYYEYQIPLKMSPLGSNRNSDVWPTENNLDLLLEDLVQAKTERNSRGIPSYIPYNKVDELGNTIVVVGNPNIGDAKTVLLGILNPKKTNQTPGDDGLSKCAEVWFNELRMTGLNEKPGYAATGKVNVQMADLGSVRLSGSMHTQGYGNIDQKLNQRFRNNFYQYNASTNLNLGKLMPRKWGVQLPVFVGYTQSVSNPQFDPYDLDVTYRDKINSARDQAHKDSLRQVAQDYTDITSFNLSNVRVLGNPEKQTKPMPWSVKNFDLSYAYNRQYKRNPLIQGDELTNHKLGLGYTYNINSKPVEPFKKLIKSKSKWFNIIKDFNFKPLPSNFTFRTELNKIMNETQVRSIGEGALPIDPTYFKNFTWLRTYNLRWELTRSLSVDYNATNLSRVDEPYGRVNTQEKRDTLWDRVRRLGRNTAFNQTFAASYTLPLQKLPITDWTTLRLTYNSSFNYTAASQLARSLGNTIGNTRGVQANGELDFRNLYNKNRWLKAINQPKKRVPKNAVAKPGQKNSARNPSAGGKDGDGGQRGRGNEPTEDTDPAAGADGGKSTGLQPDKKAPADDAKDKEQAATGAGSKQPDAKKSTIIAGVDISNLTDKQIDSLRKIQKAQDVAKKKADKAKRKKERKARRKARRATVPEISDGVRIAGRLATMVKRTAINYSEQSGTILPGFLDSTRFIGVNNLSGQPGYGFAFGYQPGRAWLEQRGAEGVLSRDSLFNANFQQQYSQNINIQTTVEPLPDLRIDLTWQQTFSKSYSELYKDTGAGFRHLSPYESGAFNITSIGLRTMFQESGPGQGPFQQFLDNRPTISRRLGSSNPYTGGVLDPNDPAYYKGYTKYSQDVLVPAFIAAYTGRSPENVALIDYGKPGNIRHNPFRFYFPLPNWRMAYTGLNKIPAVQQYVQNLVVNHGYDSRMSMNSFATSLFFLDVYNLGYPSFLDSNSGNYIPYFQLPNITITEAFSPLVGIDAQFRNNLTMRFEYRKSRTASLSLIDYQVSETKSTDYTFGLGYRVKGLNLPFEILGVRRLKNDLNVKMDVSLREDRTSNNYLAQQVDITTRGQRVVTISPSIDYIVNERLTLRLFYDRRQSIPFVSSSFPITTTRAGITLRFLFAQ